MHTLSILTRLCQCTSDSLLLSNSVLVLICQSVSTAPHPYSPRSWATILFSTSMRWFFFSFSDINCDWDHARVVFLYLASSALPIAFSVPFEISFLNFFCSFYMPTTVPSPLPPPSSPESPPLPDPFCSAENWLQSTSKASSVPPKPLLPRTSFPWLFVSLCSPAAWQSEIRLSQLPERWD